MLSYLKFGQTIVCVCLSILGLYWGGIYQWLGFVLLVTMATVVDYMAGDDNSEPSYRHPAILDGMMLSIPLLVFLLTALFFYQLSPYTAVHNTWFDTLGGILTVGIHFGAFATNIGHELIHRIKKPNQQILGRWLLALTNDAAFSISHIFTHHKFVGTEQDPSTALRGESVYRFMWRSTVGSYNAAVTTEKKRLEKQQQAWFSHHNQILTGHAMFLVYVVLAFLVAGMYGVVVYILTAIYGKAYLEFANYIEHYGLVRVPGQPVYDRHSWNSNKRISSYFLFNLSRHSHHHARAGNPYWELKALPKAPCLPHGYLIMIVIAAIPPLWYRVMDTHLENWDKHYANDKELALIQAKI